MRWRPRSFSTTINSRRTVGRIYTKYRRFSAPSARNGVEAVRGRSEALLHGPRRDQDEPDRRYFRHSAGFRIEKTEPFEKENRRKLRQDAQKATVRLDLI